MKKLGILFFLVFFSCNDGDIITESIEFGNSFESCGELVFYKINASSNETLSFQITNPTFTVNDLFETTPASSTNPPLVTVSTPNPAALGVSSTGNILNYRTYTDTPVNVFCNDVSQGNNTITQNFVSATGSAAFTITLVEDDNDGIPAELEDDNSDGDNNYLTNPLDTDGDGLPDYLDPDDDGDNVLTISENPNYDATTGLLSPQNSDNDTIPDYLDTDDDNDMVLTINEENSTTQNQNPLDDITDTTFGPDYLNNAISDVLPATAYREHEISQEFTVSLNFTDISFPNIFYSSFPFGTLNSSETTKTRVYTPDF